MALVIIAFCVGALFGVGLMCLCNVAAEADKAQNKYEDWQKHDRGDID